MADYKNIFYIIYGLSVLFALFTALNLDFFKKNYRNLDGYLVLLILLFYVFLFGLRGIDIGTDTHMYHYQYENYDHITYGTDVTVGLIYWFLNIFSENPQVFLLLMGFLFISIYFYALKKHTYFYNSNFYLSVFCLVSLFFFESLGINIIRQGVSLSFFVLAITSRAINPQKKIKWMLLLFVSICFHFTSIIAILLYLIVFYFKNIKIKYYYFLYAMTVFLAAASMSILSFKDYFLGFLSIDERRSVYLEDNDFDYSIGFKPQFVAFNTIFLLLFIYLNKREKNQGYTNLLKYYIVISSLFFMMFQIPYSDRWGVMSWCVIPFLFAPLFKVEKNSVSAKATLSVVFFIFIFIFFQTR